ncbi:DUF6979 family protein [Brevibacillus dissolubilis]|uniref:DUF6979 family protein n=1 Tax=Brevibacillus dissolubilis TaxID=1844116 RepID=UPI001115F41C
MNNAKTPTEAWSIAATDIFGHGTSSQKKGCPKNAFLGLCEEGLVTNIHPGSYCKSQKNKAYALRIIEAIQNHPDLLLDKKDLWQYATNGSGIVHNHQIDVVLSLWNHNLLTLPQKQSS